MDNFPVIDKFTKSKNGIAISITSIKPLDISGKSYEKSNYLYNTIMGYVKA